MTRDWKRAKLIPLLDVLTLLPEGMRVSKKAIYQWVEKGWLDAICPAGRWYTCLEAVDVFLNRSVNHDKRQNGNYIAASRDQEEALTARADIAVERAGKRLDAAACP